MTILGNIKRAFGYDAVKDFGRRRAITRNVNSEDDVLDARKRDSLTSGMRDLQRNYVVAAWMLRKHLDYVSTFSFLPQNDDDGLNRELTGLMDWWSRPSNIDITGRFSLPRLLRLAESRRTIDGDVLLLKLADGKLQMIEADRIRNPAKVEADDADQYVNGVRLYDDGRPRYYAVHRRDGRGMAFERRLRAEYCELLGYFDRYDQVRGISPLAPAVNALTDTYESIDYALAKLKISQFFALSFYRDQPLGGMDDVDEDSRANGYEVDFGRGPAVLDLDPGDKAEFLESKTPAAEAREFIQEMIGLTIKALDIPYSFYDEAHTNYSGARQALKMYELSAENRRGDLREVLDRLTAWRMRKFIVDGDLTLPSGMEARDLRWRWMGVALPEIDPKKAVDAEIAAINAGLLSRTEVARLHNRDINETFDNLAKEQIAMRERGIRIQEGGNEPDTDTGEISTDE